MRYIFLKNTERGRKYKFVTIYNNKPASRFFAITDYTGFCEVTLYIRPWPQNHEPSDICFKQHNNTEEELGSQLLDWRSTMLFHVRGRKFHVLNNEITLPSCWKCPYILCVKNKKHECNLRPCILQRTDLKLCDTFLVHILIFTIVVNSVTKLKPQGAKCLLGKISWWRGTLGVEVIIKQLTLVI